MAKLIVVLWLGSCGGDLASTHWAVAATHGHEANPMLSHSLITNDIVLGAGCAASAVEMSALSARRPKLALFVTGVAVAVHGWATAHNIHLAMEGGH